MIRIEPVEAARADDLRQKILSKSGEISSLEREISEYQNQLTQTTKTIRTLSSAVSSLDQSLKKVNTDIEITKKKVERATLILEQLGLEIMDKEQHIAINRGALRDAVRSIRDGDGRSYVEVALSKESFGSFWYDLDLLDKFQSSVQEHLTALASVKKELKGKEDKTTKEKLTLLDLKTRLADQQKIAEDARSQKRLLLVRTKNQESSYRTLLAQGLARKNAFEQELRQFESQLRIAIDQSALPSPGSGVLKWPLDRVVVTQYFGETDFARSRPQLYNGHGHNGIDLRASIGTPVKSALMGTVVGVGDTDLACSGASYGRWVLIRHDDGLTTLYAHLSLIRASEGDSVGTGQIIGYSGETGYATGPHLHFAVFATQGVAVGSLKSKLAGCGTYRVPRVSFNSYLNPMSFL